MIISAYSFVTAILFFSVFIVICEGLRRKNGFLLHYNISVLLCLIGLSIFRLCVPIEIPKTLIVRSNTMFPTVRQVLSTTTSVFNTTFTFGTLLLCIWVIGSLICLLRSIMHAKQDNKILKSLYLCSTEDDKITLCMERVIDHSNLKFRVVLSPKILTPMVTGVLTPTILLPQMVTELSEERLHHILTHEWQHVLNRDLFVKWVVQLLCCIMWWNPVVYLLKNSLEQALEIRCDLSVTRKMDKKEKASYLRTILLISENSLGIDNEFSRPLVFSSFGYAGAVKDFSIKQRFQVVSQYNSLQLYKSIIFVVAMIFLFLLSYTIVFQPYTETPIDDITGTINITPESSYILVNSDGTYSLIHQGAFFGDIPKEHLSNDPNNLLSIIYE